MLDPTLTGRLAIAVAAVAVASISSLALMAGGLRVFGPINDVINAVGGVVTALLVWQFHALLHERAPGLSPVFLLVALAGCAAIVVNSLLVAAGRMHWMTGGMYTALGLALQGIWLLALLRLAGTEPVFSPATLRLGTVAGALMVLGLLAGPLLVARRDLQQNPLAWIAYISVAGGWLLFPLWCWKVGWALLSGS